MIALRGTSLKCMTAVETQAQHGRPPLDEAEALLLGGGLWEDHTELRHF